MTLPSLLTTLICGSGIGVVLPESAAVVLDPLVHGLPGHSAVSCNRRLPPVSALHMLPTALLGGALGRSSKTAEHVLHGRTGFGLGAADEPFTGLRHEGRHFDVGPARVGILGVRLQVVAAATAE